MLAEMLAALDPQPGEAYVDATLGGGGYARAILTAAPCTLLGLDRDPAAVARASAIASSFKGFTSVQARFGDLATVLGERRSGLVDGIVADLGMSTDQLDDPERGFSFMADGPLDMRMGQDGPSAADLLATLDADELASIFRRYGDESDAGRVARAIVRTRERAPIERTHELRELVTRAKGGKRGPRDPSTRVFQALRIAVNDELGELERLLGAATAWLRPGGRLVIVSFHSGEDRLVKRWVEQDGERPPVLRSRHLPPTAPPSRHFVWAKRGVIQPGPEEATTNARARSAKLRVAIRTELPAEDADEPLPAWARRAA